MAHKGSMLKFIDIGVNLTDVMFQGIYNGVNKHKSDFDDVLQRAWDIGMKQIYITGSSLNDSLHAIDIAKQDDRLFCTVGCHPTRTKEFDKNPSYYFESLLNLVKNNQENVIAIGECGLDYDRLHFSPKDIQLKYFDMQFDLAECTNLPMFFHCRAASDDFLRILRKNCHKLKVGGVVHSFTGTKQEAASFLESGLYIGINGCSLKNEENIDAMLTIPTSRLLIETDSPWCEIKQTHASYKYVKTNFPSAKKEKWLQGKMVKHRNEPALILQVLEVLASTRNENIEELANIIFDNTTKLFGK